jgi:hypothetical protein
VTTPTTLTPYGGKESAYRSHLASRLREWLYDYLGGACDACGERCNLEIDHPWGRDWTPRKLSRYRRHLRYKREALAGRVRLLCRECNSCYRPVPEPTPPATSNPF